jgi:hypothetical protein
MVNVDISPLLVVSQEAMSDVYLLSATVFNRIVGDLFSNASN